MTVDFPWQLDGRGRTAGTGPDDHLRDLIEQVLFTAPGERVMRPDFGSGLLAMVFEPGGPEVASAAKYLVQAALERELSELITVNAVRVEAVDAAIQVSVTYQARHTQTPTVATFTAPGGAP